jgi:hypothetical protein
MSPSRAGWPGKTAVAGRVGVAPPGPGVVLAPGPGIAPGSVGGPAEPGSGMNRLASGKLAPCEPAPDGEGPAEAPPGVGTTACRGSLAPVAGSGPPCGSRVSACGVTAVPPVPPSNVSGDGIATGVGPPSRCFEGSFAGPGPGVPAAGTTVPGGGTGGDGGAGGSMPGSGLGEPAPPGSALPAGPPGAEGGVGLPAPAGGAPGCAPPPDGGRSADSGSERGPTLETTAGASFFSFFSLVLGFSPGAWLFSRCGSSLFGVAGFTPSRKPGSSGETDARLGVDEGPGLAAGPGPPPEGEGPEAGVTLFGSKSTVGGNPARGPVAGAGGGDKGEPPGCCPSACFPSPSGRFSGLPFPLLPSGFSPLGFPPRSPSMLT